MFHALGGFVMSRTITRPLSELDQVDWASLNHAYGSAEDVPDQLRAIAKGDEEAFSDAFGNLWHQGTVYSATAAAVPFLIGLLEAGYTKLFLLLDCMAQGSGYFQVHQVYDSPEKIAEPEYQATLMAEAQWVKDTHQAVAAGVDIYRSFLKNSDSDVVVGAVQLLARLQSIEPKVVDWLWACLQKNESLIVKANCAWALQWTKNINSEGVKVLQSLVTQAQDSQVAQLAQFTAALALACQQGNQTPFSIVEVLVKILQERDIEELYDLLNGSYCNAYEDLENAAFMTNQTAVFAQAYWEKCQKTGDFDCALYALELTHPTLEAPLTPLACHILKEIVQQEKLHSFSYVLKNWHGLPDTREELVALLKAHDVSGLN